MATWRKVIMTDAGRALFAQAFADKKAVEFASVAIGSGAYEDSETGANRTTLKSEKARFAVSSVTHVNAATIKVGSTIDNSSVSVGFSLSEMGWFCKLADSENEVLAFLDIATQPEPIPAPSVTPITIITENYIGLAGNDAKVELTVSPPSGLYATLGDLLTAKTALQGEIDDCKDELDDAAREWSVSLPLAGWSTSFPYKQTVTVSGMKAAYQPLWWVYTTPSTTEAGLKVIDKAGIYLVTTAAGSITVYARKKPTTALTLKGKGV